MRLCPACGNSFPDDANFCPMDATRLPPPAAAPAAVAPAVKSGPSAATVMDGGHTAIAQRFLISGAGRPTPTGTEHEAKDTHADGATVTLKLVGAEVLPNAAMADRALRELKQLGKVASDRIVRVVDQGRADDGRVYVATEVLSGTTLDQLVKQGGPLPVDRATAIVLQIGEALTEAQKVGVIHRDVAPRNVMVLPGDKVKVAEFGLAEAVPGPAGEAGGAERSGSKVFGAPAFLSPEQVEGRPVDQRSNIYSLGAMFYFALTGEPPFAGDAQSLLQQQLHATPQPPSSRRADLPPEIDRIILKALEKSGGRRHLTLRQLLSEIEASAGSRGAPAQDNARTVMQQSPPDMTSPSPAARPAAATKPMAATMMGIPTPLGQPPPQAAPPATAKPSPSAAPATAPAMAAADARTVMAEAPKLEPQKPAAAAMQSTQATMMANAPSATAATAPKGVPANASPQVQAAVAAAQAKVAAEKPLAGAQPNAPQKAGGFRETAWFKVGELEEERAKAEAEAAHASGGDVLAPTGTTGEHGAVDPSQVNVSAQDKARLSLKTGATQMMAAVKAPVGVSGEQMDEQEMLAEIDSSKKWFIIAGAIVGLVVIGLVLYFLLGNKEAPKAEVAPKPEAVAAAPPAAGPTGAPPPVPEKLPPAAPVPPPAVVTSVQLLADAETAAAKGNLAAAVELFGKGVAAGADPREVKRAQATLLKTAVAQMARAKKKKDRAGEAEAKAVLARLRKVK